MNATLHLFWQKLENVRWETALADAAIKGFVLLALAWVCCVCCRKACAAARHLIWFGAILGVLCFPLITWFVPAWQRPLWAVGTRLDPGNQVAVVVTLRPDQTGAKSRHARAATTPGPTASDRTGRSSQGPGPLSTELKLRWTRMATYLWGAGLLLALVRVCGDQFRLRALQRNALPVSCEEWLPLVHELRRQLNLRRPVMFLQSNDNVMPVTWGSFRPVVMLPTQAGQWPIERRRVVLLHELAHVRRWDCLSQFIGQIACALYWFNPLVWMASRQMRIERERACDDLVLNGGIEATEYAAHLLEIARTFTSTPRLAGIAMARPSRLRERISSIVENTRSRGLGRLTSLAVLLALGTAVLGIGGNQAGFSPPANADSQALLDRQLAQLRSFSVAKLKQSQDLAARAGQQISPEFERFFDAAVAGDSQTVTNMYEDFKKRHPQYSHGTDGSDVSLSTPYWSPVLELCLAYDHVIRCAPKYTALLADRIINSIPAGSAYFGGTDPGRGVPTAFEKSQIDGDPFFVLTQNALADGTYLEYLRQTYAGKLFIPSEHDSQECFNNYLSDALRRLKHDQQFPTEPKQVRPGEHVRMENGQGEVSGQAAVMGINGILSKMIFDRNPGREFYVEESLPLDWMYPYLEPHGLIMKIDREPPAKLPEETIARDHAYWHILVSGTLGDWLDQDTPVSAVTGFAQRVFAQHDLAGFSGDPGFIQNDYSKRIFSKLRSSIAGVYAWRTAHAANPAEAQRMAVEADLAFRQAFALCPYSPEAVFRYTTFLSQNNRHNDALAIAAAASAVDPKSSEIRSLVQNLNRALEAK